jgi:hypothetical protein
VEDQDMKKMSSVRFALGLVAATLMLGVAATGCVAGDAGSAPDVGSEAQASVVTITAGSVARLQPGETLAVDLRDTTTIYQLSVAEGPIDFSRIEITAADEPSMPMDQWLTLQQQKEPKLDVETMMNQGFAIGGSEDAAHAYAAQREGGASTTPGYETQAVGVCVIVSGGNWAVIVCVWVN